MIVIDDYNPTWPGEFEAIAARLQAVLGPWAQRIDHIGSTSVPGLGAKNIIDVQITVQALNSALAEKLIAIGYGHRPEIDRDHVPAGEDPNPERWRKQFFFLEQPAGRRRVNAHVRMAGNPNQRYAILFRDYLRMHPNTARAVERIKREIARYHPNDEDAYYDIKDPVYDLIWEAAKEWAQLTDWKR
jgi:GrpB-like predicted nucleotidyltransferase (UPF0157 family)